MTMNGVPEEAHLEIERRFLIEKPSEEALRALPGADYTDITQTYLVAESGCTERVRQRGRDGAFTFTHTLKRRLNGFTHSEDEREISLAQYETLLTRADPQRRAIHKRRYTLPQGGHVFEIDLYPFWTRQAIMEVELTSEDEAVSLPVEIAVKREITGQRPYSNAALALAIPEEDQ